MKSCEMLKQWFLRERRDLPWRQNATPYAVWVSEVMLQQTQVAVVIPYFERWMAQFPTIQALAEAPLDAVIKSWEGLGYYSRARNLHAGAKQVMEHFEGELPNTPEDLAKVKGLGPYTIGAILSFAFHQKVPAVDGNVVRVLARYYQVEEDISKPKTVNQIRTLAVQFLPENESWIVSEALIELGATVCKRQPQCKECPLRSNCQAYKNGATMRLPLKSAKIKAIDLYRAVAIIQTPCNHFLIRRGKQGEIMHDLHEFPYFETDAKGICNQTLAKQIHTHLGLQAHPVGSFPDVKHGFTRYRARLKPVAFECPQMHPVEGFEWHSREKLQQLAFSSGHRRLLAMLQKA